MAHELADSHRAASRACPRSGPGIRSTAEPGGLTDDGTAPVLPHPAPMQTPAPYPPDEFADLVVERFAGGIPSASPSKPLLMQDEVAARLNVSPRTVDTLVASGELVPIRVTPGGRGCRFTYESTKAFIRSRAVGR